MDINNRVDHMDEELQLLKNEIKQVLLEIQEHVLNIQNPFTGVGSGSKNIFNSSATAPEEPVFTDPLIPEPEPPKPEPAPVATEISVTTKTETAAPVTAPVAAAPAPAAPAPVAPAAPTPVAPTPPPAPAGGTGGNSGPAYVPPPMPPVMPQAMPAMPFVPPSGGFGGPAFGGPTQDWDARERDHDRADRDRDRADRDRDRKEREHDREMDGDSDGDIRRGKGLDKNLGGDRDPDMRRDEDRDSVRDRVKSEDGDGPSGRSTDSSATHDGSPDGKDVAFHAEEDGKSAGSSREFADVLASLEDEAGMPGLPPSDGARKTSGGAKQTPDSGSDDKIGGSLGPPGAAFNIPGLNLDGKAVDLVTMAGLIQWAYSVLSKIGSEHMFSLLDVSARTGRIPEETRDVLLSVIPIFEMAGQAEDVTVKEIIATLAELDGFMGNISPEDARLLPFLLQDEMEVFPLIRPR